MNLVLRPNAQAFSQPVHIAEVIELYLRHARAELAPLAFEGRKQVLDDFKAQFGAVRLDEAKGYHLQLWLDGHPDWKSNWTRKRCIAGVNRAMNWAVKLGLLDRNPFRGVSAPPGERGTPITLDEYQAILRHSPSPAFRRFVIALRFTGARPGELAKATWADVDLDRACIELKQHKTAKATGKPRRIVLHPVLLKMLAWLKCRGHGPLVFPNKHGKRWTNPAIAWHIRELRRCGAIKPDTTLYGLRHLACTQAVTAGVSFPIIAELMGHSRIQTTMHYVHLAQRTGVLQTAIAQVFNSK